MGSARRKDNAPAAGSDIVASKRNRFHVGCSGWFCWHWRGDFYPAASSPRDWFKIYAKKFRTVELNAPFYSWPTLQTVKTWARQAGILPFVYSVKVNEIITHQKRMVGTKRLIRDFGYIAGILGPRFGCFLYQFPPSFRYSPAALKRLLSQLDPSRRNVAEFRHRSWWNADVYRAFRDSGTSFCSSSAPRMPDELIDTAEDLYIRFHGTLRWYRHNYTKAALSSRAKRVWIYLNNDRDGFATTNASTLQRRLHRSN